MGEIILRQYQKDCLDAIVRAIPNDKDILFQAATGAGKTIIFCSLIKHLLTEWPYIRIGILAHRRELITQNRDKLLSVWPDAPVGIACTSVTSQVITETPVVIGTIQTLVRRIEDTSPFEVIIIDEAHRIPPINLKSTYRKWVLAMREHNPNVRIIGCTATPFRLGHGYIFGKACKPRHDNLFPKLHYSIGIRALQKENYLCEYHAMEAEDVSDDLKNVRVSGDYNLGDLSNVMSRPVHLGSAVSAIQKYAEDRKRIIVFCCTIDHSEKLVTALKKENIVSAYIHSKMPIPQRDMILKEFEAGRIRVLCNIGVLTEGWDSPAVDCVLLCRPTKSTGLYVQMVGRGLRPHPDKKNVLILDLSSNCTYHGDPNNPSVKIANTTNYNKQAPTKICPECQTIHFLGVKECNVCGYVFIKEPEVDNGSKHMRDVSWIRHEAPIVVTVEHIEAQDYISQNGNRMLKVSMRCRRSGALIPVFVNHFFDFEGNGSDRGMIFSRRLWENLAGTDPPETVEEAKEREHELFYGIPARIEIRKKERWWNVEYWGIKAWNKAKEEKLHGIPEELPF